MLMRILQRKWESDLKKGDWLEVSEAGREFVSKCLKVEPGKRWKASEAKVATWFKTVLEGDHETVPSRVLVTPPLEPDAALGLVGEMLVDSPRPSSPDGSELGFPSLAESEYSRAIDKLGLSSTAPARARIPGHLRTHTPESPAAPRSLLELGQTWTPGHTLSAPASTDSFPSRPTTGTLPSRPSTPLKNELWHFLLQARQASSPIEAPVGFSAQESSRKKDLKRVAFQDSPNSPNSPEDASDDDISLTSSIDAHSVGKRPSIWRILGRIKDLALHSKKTREKRNGDGTGADVVDH
jgi:hypothetical protein